MYQLFFPSVKIKNKLSKKPQNICSLLGQLPVMVPSHAPDTDAADWLRVEQAAVFRVNQGQHAILELQQHSFTL